MKEAFGRVREWEACLWSNTISISHVPGRFDLRRSQFKAKTVTNSDAGDTMVR